MENPIVVLFSSQRRADAPIDDYRDLARRMGELVAVVPGYISSKTYTSRDGETLTVARFESEAALAAWRDNAEHQDAQRRGQEDFYDAYAVQVCRLEREYAFTQESGRAVLYPAGS